MIIALAQLNFQIGNLVENERRMVDALQKAKQQGADLIVFPEMAIGGYPAMDLWLSEAFIRACRTTLDNLARHCDSISCIVGLPTVNRSPEQKGLHNSAAFIRNGEIQRFVHKMLIPDYDVFDEFRYFQPGEETASIQVGDHKIALTICEDLWDVEAPVLYEHGPMDHLAIENPDLLINIAASPFALGQFAKRRNVLSHHARACGKPVLYVNQVGAHADLIFDGHSLVLDGSGTLVDIMPGFKEALQYYRVDTGRQNGALVPLQDVNLQIPAEGSETVYQALTFGIKDYFDKMGFRSAVLGLSGGLDSALVAALACAALGPERVHAVLMPSQYSSDHSIQDALDLVRNTGCHHVVVPIGECADAFDRSLAEAFEGTAPGVAEENIQARIRGILLMAFSNKFGHILLNTSNKSEAAVGYGTLYGDMAGSLGVIGDVYKTEAYDLASFINREREIIPVNTVVKPPSAELRPDQKDSDSLPDYAVLDPILRLYIEEGKDPDVIIAQGHDAATVERVTKMVDQAEFKRFQSPPILRVSKKAFGAGRSFSLVAKKVYPRAEDF